MTCTSMKSIKNLSKLFLFILIITSCSDDSSGPGDLGLNEGKGSFTVTGDVNAEHEGEAWYVIDRDNNGTVFQIFVSDIEFSTEPQVDDVQFVLEFKQDSGSNSFSISTGDFNMGENATFRGIFADVPTTTGYETLGNNGGSLTIFSYSNGLVDAEFEFAATDPIGGASVTVSGALRATCLGGQFNPNC